MVKIIAEAATCHGGQLELAKSLVLMAADAGADTIKFQHIVPERLYSPRAMVSGKWIQNPAILSRTKELLSNEDLISLKQYADRIGIEFALTLFDIGSLEMVSMLGLPFVKIASGDLSFFPFLEQISSLDVPIILSTGMASMSEISTAISVLNPKNINSLTLLHCVSVYPCPPSLVNLARITELQKFGFMVGYSDHSLGDWAAHSAVALGAEVIEKHVRLSSGPITPDFDHSMSEIEFTKFVNSIRDVERGLLENPNSQSIEESLVQKRARRGVYAAKDIETGQVISESDFMFLRPESEFTPMNYQQLIGKKVLKKIGSGEPIEATYLQ